MCEKRSFRFMILDVTRDNDRNTVSSSLPETEAESVDENSVAVHNGIIII